MILLIDNYDSFTYNLVQRLGEIDASLQIEVVRNDQISVEEVVDRKPDRVIISPGPCTPSDCTCPESDAWKNRFDLPSRRIPAKGS